MAIREEHDFLSENERAFLFDAIHNRPHVRADGRELMQQRKIRVQFRRTEEQAQAEVQLGRTRVIAIVHGEIVPPFPDRPTEGFLHFNVELSPMASQNFEVGRPSPMAVELARIVDRGIRECRALDTEALAIIAGEKVWAITCTIHVVDHGGNLIDCVSLAAIAAMMHYRRPEVSVQNNATVVYNIDEHAAVPLSLHHIPISISFCFIERRDSAANGGSADDDTAPIIFMDPTDREERITDGSMTFTFNSFRELCAVHKIGGAAISTTDVLRCANVAAARVSELTELLKSEAEKADKVAIDQRRAFLRGRDFADVSSLAAADDATRQLHRTQVDLGAMTDFGTLHAPIALRDDPSAEETDAKVTSMAELLESLETAAESAEPDATDAASSSGLAMNDDDAREEFQKLSASLSLRALVAGAKTAAAPAAASALDATASTAANALKTAKTTKAKTKKAKKKVEESDSEEESVVVQSEFDGAAPVVAPAPPVAPTKSAKPTKKPKKKVASSDDDSEEEDLSAAIKRKPRKMHKRVKVCVRVRPSAQATAAGVVVKPQEQTISVVTDAATGNGTCFHFDQVLDARVDQRGVFEDAARDVVDSVLSGYNGTIMAYGQTGAGKTFTMSGGKQAFEDRGICARAISAIFQHIQRDAEHTYAVRVSYVEVYNESLYDLLDLREHAAASGPRHHPVPSSSNANSNNARDDHLVIQETEKGQTFIKGLARPLVANEEAAFDLLFQGETNRTIAEHYLNAASTRSHCIFTVYIEKKTSALDSSIGGSSDDAVVVYSKLNLVDLAGSERMKKTGVSGTMLKEASHINKSLTFLEQVVIALGDKKRQHIPYRQTTLTNLLKDSLSGNCRTLLLACVWPDASHNDQSLATLKFATRMLRVKTSAVVNIAQSAASKLSAGVASHVVAKYTDEIARLKAELAMYDTLNGRSHVDYDAHAITSPEQQARYKQDVLRFIADSSAHPLPIVNLLQLQQLFLAFRDVCREQQAQVEALSGRIQQQQLHSYPCSTRTDAPDRPSSASKMVKQLRSLRASSPAHSAASHTASPPRKLPLVTMIPAAAMLPAPPETPESVDYVRTSVALPPIAPERQLLPERSSTAALSDKELFQTFIKLENPKPESILDVELAKQNLRHAKAQFATCGLEVNQLKLEIDGLSLKLQELRAATASSERDDAPSLTISSSSERMGNQVAAESSPTQLTTAANSTSNEHFLLVMQLKDAKKRYRDTFERFQERKAEVSYLVKIKDQMLAHLTHEFERWKHTLVQQQLEH